MHFILSNPTAWPHLPYTDSQSLCLLVKYCDIVQGFISLVYKSEKFSFLVYCLLSMCHFLTSVKFKNLKLSHFKSGTICIREMVVVRWIHWRDSAHLRAHVQGSSGAHFRVNSSNPSGTPAMCVSCSPQKTLIGRLFHAWLGQGDWVRQFLIKLVLTFLGKTPSTTEFCPSFSL